MARLMSVTLTKRAVYERRKTETRRAGWTHLQPGTILELCEKVMGRKKGDPLVRICLVEVIDVRRERLDAITDAGVDREGFGPWEGSDGIDWWPPGSVPPADEHGPAAEAFVDFFCREMGGTPDQLVNVITWRYTSDPQGALL